MRPALQTGDANQRPTDLLPCSLLHAAHEQLKTHEGGWVAMHCPAVVGRAISYILTYSVSAEYFFIVKAAKGAAMGGKGVEGEDC